MDKNALSVEKQLDRILALECEIQFRNIRLDEQVIERTRALHPKAQIGNRVVRGTGEWRTLERKSVSFRPEAHPPKVLNALIVPKPNPVAGIDVGIRRGDEVTRRQS